VLYSAAVLPLAGTAMVVNIGATEAKVSLFFGGGLTLCCWLRRLGFEGVQCSCFHMRTLILIFQPPPRPRHPHQLKSLSNHSASTLTNPTTLTTNPPNPTNQVESVMNDYVRLVEQESSYQDLFGDGGALVGDDDDLVLSDGEGFGGAGAGGEASVWGSGRGCVGGVCFGGCVLYVF